MHSPYSLFISRSQSPSFSLPHPHAGQLRASEGWKKAIEKGTAAGERRKIEHPPLFCQSVSSVKHCNACCFPHGMQGPFHLTWLCKRFSQRPKGGECQGLDKVPCLPDGPCWREGETVEWSGVEWRGSQVPKSVYRILQGESWECEERQRTDQGRGKVCESVCVCAHLHEKEEWVNAFF